MEVMIIIPIIILFIVIWIISSIKTDDSLQDSHKEKEEVKKPIHKDEDGEKHSYKSPIYEKKESWKDSYNEDLNDERWKEKREKILKRDGYKCRWCGSIDRLQVHHKYYNKYPDGSRVRAWDYPDDALMVLCDDCHKKYHSKYKVKSYYRKTGVHYEKV